MTDFDLQPSPADLDLSTHELSAILDSAAIRARLLATQALPAAIATLHRILTDFLAHPSSASPLPHPSPSGEVPSPRGGGGSAPSSGAATPPDSPRSASLPSLSRYEIARRAATTLVRLATSSPRPFRPAAGGIPQPPPSGEVPRPRGGGGSTSPVTPFSPARGIPHPPPPSKMPNLRSGSSLASDSPRPATSGPSSAAASGGRSFPPLSAASILDLLSIPDHDSLRPTAHSVSPSRPTQPARRAPNPAVHLINTAGLPGP